MSAFILRIPVVTRRFYLVMGLLIAAAWGLLFAWQRSAYAELLGHESLADEHILPGWHLAAFLLSWFLMTAAMMLPGSLPTLIRYVQPLLHPVKHVRLAGLVILGYLCLWVVFGLLVFLGDSFLHEMTEPAAPLAAFSNWIAPAIVLAAGLYQFTPFKRRFMARCRPADALAPQDRGEKVGGAVCFKLGLRLGGACMGSCWSLMLLMFALGQHRLDWMLALGGILAAERLAPWGHRLAWVVGIGLVVWGAFWIIS